MPAQAARLRELIARPGFVDLMGAHDTISARLIEHTGFDCIYIGGHGVTATIYGLPDFGLVTIPELIDHARHVTAVVDVPVVIDLDDGGGNPLRVRRAVHLAEQAGVAGFHLEDSYLGAGKHYPATTGAIDHSHDRLIDPDTFAESVLAAAEARRDPDTLVIIRTDASLVTSVDDAIQRAKVYADAGADAVFLNYLPLEQVARAVAEIRVPLMMMQHAPPIAVKERLTADGLKMLIHPLPVRLAAFRAVHELLRNYRETGEFRDFETWRPKGTDLSAAEEAPAWADLARRYGMILDN